AGVLEGPVEDHARLADLLRQGRAPCPTEGAPRPGRPGKADTDQQGDQRQEDSRLSAGHQGILLVDRSQRGAGQGSGPDAVATGPWGIMSPGTGTEQVIPRKRQEKRSCGITQ